MCPLVLMPVELFLRNLKVHDANHYNTGIKEIA